MRILTIFALLLFTLCSYSQQETQSELSSIEKGLAVITKTDAEAHIILLASDSLEGREAGKLGGKKAAEYIENHLKEIGLKPWRGKYQHVFTPDRVRDQSDKGVEMYNVIGYIPGENTDEVVMVGAHYDHLGIRANNTSDSIYNGADDNASGVSAVLQVAKAFVESGQKPKRSVVFALWDGEEKGLLGSFHFVEDHYSYIPIPLTSPITVKAHVNCDMIGRDKKGDKTHVDALISESKPIFNEWIKSDIETYGLNLNPVFPSMESSPGGSDHMPFMYKGVPVIFYNTDLHADYHKPSDEADKINYDKVVDVTKLAFLNLWRMANEKDF